MSTEQEKKGKFLRGIAEDNGVAVVILDDRSREVALANNNSICRLLWDSETFAPACAKDCGAALANTSSGQAFDFECHAGLSCRAIPVQDQGRRFVAIVGRTFQRSENYRKATEKAINGEWSTFKPTELFANILMSGSSAGIDNAAAALSKFTVTEPDELLELEVPFAKASDEITDMVRQFNEGTATNIEIAVPERRTAFGTRIRSLAGSIMQLEYREACSAVLDLLQDDHEFPSVIWLERSGDKLIPVVSRGELQGRPIRVNLRADDSRLAEAAEQDQPLVLRERRQSAESAGRSLSIFPAKIGSEVRSAIAIEADISDPDTIKKIKGVSKAITPQVEILRLRNEVARRESLANGLEKFNEKLRHVDTEDFWLGVTQVSAELLGAERGSLLIFDETTNKFTAKAAFGSAIDLFKAENIGNRIARRALETGSPITVADLLKIGVEKAPSEWRYRTDSFVSYPLAVGDRRFGVMSFTDRADGSAFSERDLELLNIIGPQVAMAMDRTNFKSQALEFEQRSLTDALTGLRNRGYLEERLTEEISQARRYRSSMCLLMIDIDNFKSYNDSFGHSAGDAVLKMVSEAFRVTLRTADVAARYGGEEFAILLPHTSVEEAAVIAERIRQRVEHSNFPHRRVTISLGLAGYSTEFEEPKDWIDAADVALYDVKEHGRNGIQIYERLGRSFREKIN